MKPIWEVVSSLLCFGFAALSAGAVSPVVPVGVPASPYGLDGRNIALWPSHGKYYNQEKQQWLWQRAPLMQTIEDLYSTSYVYDLLAPMLENAGAYVLMPRERDINGDVELIIDADSPSRFTDISASGVWSIAPDVPGFKAPSKPLHDGDNPFRQGTVQRAAMSAKGEPAPAISYKAEIPRDGTYSIYVSYATLPNSAEKVTYAVNSLRGREEFLVNQKMGAGTWMRLGEFPLAEGRSQVPVVEIIASDPDGTQVGKTVTADAVRIGGGMGSVARSSGKEEAVVSGLPRWMEGSRYWLQYAGAPRSVYSDTGGENDYTDDFKSRPLWVNWLAGGSSKIPDAKGLNIPIDMSMGFHTDAGVTPDSTTIGTLGIYSTDGGRKLGNGGSRNTNKALTEAIVGQITDDIRALHDCDWTRRKLRDRKYAEARIPDVPATLLELLSHQNYGDMLLGQDPLFRFDAARAIYKGILKYLAGPKGKYVVQPLPVNSFAITSAGDGKYRLSWLPTKDPLEPSAIPTAYIIERRYEGQDFTSVATTSADSFEVSAEPGHLATFRIVAMNEGGRSFPSEALALCYVPGRNPEVLVVNGFTRIGPPDAFDIGDATEAGFLDEIDHGVPYIRNLGYVGSQYDFSRESQWEDDVVKPGFGASDVSFAGHPVAGNTFDFTAVHGRAIVAAGYGFVSTSVAGYLRIKDWPQTIVDLILGKQKQVERPDSTLCFKAFPTSLQKKLRGHTDKGGSLLVSGSYIGYDLFDNLYSDKSTLKADMEFARDVLGISYEQPHASVGGAIEVLPFWTNSFETSRLQYSAEVSEKIYVIESPDAIIGAYPELSHTIMLYDETGLGAAVASYRRHAAVIAMGFPFETIISDMQRKELMGQIMAYLTTVKRPMAPSITIHKWIPEHIIDVPDPDTTPAEDIVMPKTK